MFNLALSFPHENDLNSAYMGRGLKIFPWRKFLCDVCFLSVLIRVCTGKFLVMVA